MPVERRNATKIAKNGTEAIHFDTLFRAVRAKIPEITKAKIGNSGNSRNSGAFDGGAAIFRGGLQAPPKKKGDPKAPEKKGVGVGGGYQEIRDFLLCCVLAIMLMREGSDEG